eukprot:6193232-Pleurochrysis_carterae.AAC.2
MKRDGRLTNLKSEDTRGSSDGWASTGARNEQAGADVLAGLKAGERVGAARERAGGGGGGGEARAKQSRRDRECLDVVLRVPVGVVDDDGVGRDEVDPDAARARAQQEEKGGRALGREAVDRSLKACGERACACGVRASCVCLCV